MITTRVIHSRVLHTCARLTLSSVLVVVAACATDESAEGHEPPPPGTGETTPSTDTEKTAPVVDVPVAADAPESMEARVLDIEPGLVVEPVPGEGGTPSVDETRAIAEDVAATTPTDIRAYIFDRVIMKPKKGTLVDKEAVRAMAERTTGAAVSDVKIGPRGTFLVVFSKATTPRDKAAQEALVRALRATGNFEYVEPDVIMTAR